MMDYLWVAAWDLLGVRLGLRMVGRERISKRKPVKQVVRFRLEYAWWWTHRHSPPNNRCVSFSFSCHNSSNPSFLWWTMMIYEIVSTIYQVFMWMPLENLDLSALITTMLLVNSYTCHMVELWIKLPQMCEIYIIPMSNVWWNI